IAVFFNKFRQPFYLSKICRIMIKHGGQSSGSVSSVLAVIGSKHPPPHTWQIVSIYDLFSFSIIAKILFTSQSHDS
ncbi:hypothetical protein M3M33_16885, partial [Loigolactobacillus coryniformis]|uniref:hypothetical protein n=1 Tax=Loigolactobacillus coryniformis TaxID=1610 RepID=UPI00201A9605